MYKKYKNVQRISNNLNFSPHHMTSTTHLWLVPYPHTGFWLDVLLNFSSHALAMTFWHLPRFSSFTPAACCVICVQHTVWSAGVKCLTTPSWISHLFDGSSRGVPANSTKQRWASGCQKSYSVNCDSLDK